MIRPKNFSGKELCSKPESKPPTAKETVPPSSPSQSLPLFPPREYLGRFRFLRCGNLGEKENNKGKKYVIEFSERLSGWILARGIYYLPQSSATHRAKNSGELHFRKLPKFAL